MHPVSETAPHPKSQAHCFQNPLQAPRMGQRATSSEEKFQGRPFPKRSYEISKTKRSMRNPSGRKGSTYCISATIRYGFAAAARSMGVDAQVLPRPDEESEKLGRPHSVGGECHPYLLVLR